VLTDSDISAILQSLFLIFSLFIPFFVCLFTPILPFILQVAIFVSKENDFEKPISTDSKSALYKLYLNIHRNCIVSVYSSNSSSRRHGSGNVIINGEEDTEENIINLGNDVDTVDYQYGEHGSSKNETDGIESFKRNYERSFNDLEMYEGRNQFDERIEMSALGDKRKSDNESKRVKSINCAENDGANSRDNIDGSRSNVDGCVGESNSGSECKHAHGNSSEDGSHGVDMDRDRDRGYSGYDVKHIAERQNQSVHQYGIQRNSVSTVIGGSRQTDNMSYSRRNDNRHNSSNYSEANLGSSSALKKREMQNRNFDRNNLYNNSFLDNVNRDGRYYNSNSNDNDNDNDDRSDSRNSDTSSASCGNNNNDNDGSHNKRDIGNDHHDRQYYRSSSHSCSSSSSSNGHMIKDRNNDSNNNDNSDDNDNNNRSDTSNYDHDHNGFINCKEKAFRSSNSAVHENQKRNRNIDRRNDKCNNGNVGPNFNNNSTGDRSTSSNGNDYGNRSESVNQHALGGVPTDNRDNSIQLLNSSYNISAINDSNRVRSNGNNGLNENNSSSSGSHIAQRSQTAQFTPGNYSRNNVKGTFFDTVKRDNSSASVSDAVVHRKDPSSSHSHGDGHDHGDGDGDGGKDISYMNMYSVTSTNMNANMSAKQTVMSSNQGEKVRFNYDDRAARQRIHGPNVGVNIGTSAADSELVHSASTSTGAAFSQKKGNNSFFSNQDSIDVHSIHAARKHTQIGNIEYGEGNYESKRDNSAFFETSNGDSEPAITSMLLSTVSADSSLGAKKKKVRSAD
jgi:hypothetical protein